MTRRTLTSEDIFAANDMEQEWVDTPEWGENVGVYIQVISAGDRDKLEESMFENLSDGSKSQARNFRDLRAKLVTLSSVDENGKSIFKWKEYVKLSEKSSLVVGRLYAVAQRLNKLRSADVAELTENLSKGQKEDSPTD